jgi:hypothetical protein
VLFVLLTDELGWVHEEKLYEEGERRHPPIACSFVFALDIEEAGIAQPKAATPMASMILKTKI